MPTANSEMTNSKFPLGKRGMRFWNRNSVLPGALSFCGHLHCGVAEWHN